MIVSSRFLQPDPIGYAGGLNLYTYVGNNPLNWIDPFGLMPTFNFDGLPPAGLLFPSNSEKNCEEQVEKTEGKKHLMQSIHHIIFEGTGPFESWPPQIFPSTEALPRRLWNQSNPVISTPLPPGISEIVGVAEAAPDLVKIKLGVIRLNRNARGMDIGMDANDLYPSISWKKNWEKTKRKYFGK